MTTIRDWILFTIFSAIAVTGSVVLAAAALDVLTIPTASEIANYRQPSFDPRNAHRIANAAR